MSISWWQDLKARIYLCNPVRRWKLKRLGDSTRKLETELWGKESQTDTKKS